MVPHPKVGEIILIYCNVLARRVLYSSKAKMMAHLMFGTKENSRKGETTTLHSSYRKTFHTEGARLDMARKMLEDVLAAIWNKLASMRDAALRLERNSLMLYA